MPVFVVVPATPDDLGSVAQLQFDACGSDPAFQAIFPHGASASSLQYAVTTMEATMDCDLSAHLVLAKHAMTGEIISYAQWHFFTSRRQQEDAVDEELLQDSFPWPADADAETGNRLVRNATRKRHQVIGKWFGWGSPYAYLSAVGTAPKYRRQGAASLLLKWGVERADDYNLPAYVEATQPGYSLYRRHGFEEVDHLTIEPSQCAGQLALNYCMIRPAARATD